MPFLPSGILLRPSPGHKIENCSAPLTPPPCFAFRAPPRFRVMGVAGCHPSFFPCRSMMAAVPPLHCPNQAIPWAARASNDLAIIIDQCPNCFSKFSGARKASLPKNFHAQRLINRLTESKPRRGINVAYENGYCEGPHHSPPMADPRADV